MLAAAAADVKEWLTRNGAEDSIDFIEVRLDKVKGLLDIAHMTPVGWLFMGSGDGLATATDGAATPWRPRMARVTHDVIATCPVCDGELQVTRLHCDECGTTLDGRFAVGRFGRLSREQLALLESFLRSRGNLRDMERELGISYPTVRNRVEALVRALGLGGEPVPVAVAGDAAGTPSADDAAVAAQRRAVLERLARHEISAEDAATLIRAMTPSGGPSDA
jgi:hypothetical protein